MTNLEKWKAGLTPETFAEFAMDLIAIDCPVQCIDCKSTGVVECEERALAWANAESEEATDE